MKYNKYCSNKYSSKYNTDDRANSDNEICNISIDDYSINHHSDGKIEVKYNKENEMTNSDEMEYECNNCMDPCKCCTGLECDFNRGKVESIRTLVKRLFTNEKTESCPAIEEITEVEGSTAMEINLELIPSSCNCQCPPVDSTSRFTVKCVEVEANNVTLGDV